MRISDWSSDVCSSDLMVECRVIGFNVCEIEIVRRRAIRRRRTRQRTGIFECTKDLRADILHLIPDREAPKFQIDIPPEFILRIAKFAETAVFKIRSDRAFKIAELIQEIGRASCRERVCQYV